MNGEKSDSAIRAMKPANKAGQPAAEWVEAKAGGQGEHGHHTRTGHRTGRRCPRGWNVYGKAQGNVRRRRFTAASAPRHGRSAYGRRSMRQAASRTWCGWPKVGGLRGGTGGQPPGLARTGPSRSVTARMLQFALPSDPQRRCFPPGFGM